jgi:hypothetical protein
MLRIGMIPLVVLLLASTSGAFLSAPQRLVAIRSVPGPKSSVVTNNAIIVSRGPGSLAAKKGDVQPKEEIDWGKIAALFLFPGNPYAWFVYFFAFIIACGSFSGN